MCPGGRAPSHALLPTTRGGSPSFGSQSKQRSVNSEGRANEEHIRGHGRHLSFFIDSHVSRQVEDRSRVGRASMPMEDCDESNRTGRRNYENGAGERGAQHGGAGRCLQLTFPPARWPEKVELGRAQRRNASETYRIHGRGGSGRKMASPRGRQGLWRGRDLASPGARPSAYL